jgi:HEAT repeat protein
MRDLIDRFNARDPNIAGPAADELRRLTDDQISELVARLPEDMYTIKALVALGDRAVPFLLASAERAGISWDTANALTMIGERRVIPLLVRELHRPGSPKREMAASCLGDLGAVEQIPELRAMLDDPDPAVADEAAGSLGKLGDIESVAAIARAAAASDADQVQAIYGLSLLDHPIAHDQLLRLLEHLDEWVRLAAIRGLGRSGYRPAVGPLLAMAERADAEELDAILTALAQLPDVAAIPLLEKAAREWNYPASPNPASPTLAELAIRALAAIRTGERPQD